MSKNIAVMGMFNSNAPTVGNLENLLNAALNPLGIPPVVVKRFGSAGILVLVGDVDDDLENNVHLEIEKVIESLGGTYQYPDN